MAQSYQSTCEDVVDKLTSSLKDENGALNYAFNSLQQVLKSDPEQDATIPKPREIFNKVSPSSSFSPPRLMTSSKPLSSPISSSPPKSASAPGRMLPSPSANGTTPKKPSIETTSSRPSISSTP